MAKAYVFFAEGLEEVEALTVVDLLRRADVQVQMVSITGNKMVTGSHGISIETDILFDEIHMDTSDAFILPGGMPGTRNLQKCESLISVLLEAEKKGKLLGAICAAPLVLGQNQMLKGKKACCYPGFEEELVGANISMEPVCHDGNIITSRGLGTAIAFAGEIIASLVNEEKAKEITESVLSYR